MKLFEEPKNVRKGYHEGGESTYTYFRDSDREDVKQRKRFLESWFASYPDDSKKDLLGRFQNTHDEQHLGAMWELVLFKRMCDNECKVEVGPRTKAGKVPDFLVTNSNGERFYMEAAVVFEQIQREQRRKEKFLNLLNTIRSKNFILSVDENMETFPQQIPSAKALKAEVESWLGGLDWSTVKARYDDSDYTGLPKRVCSYGPWELEFTAFPREKREIDNGIDKMIISVGTAIHQCDIVASVEKAIRAKGKKYPSLDAPLVVAVNVFKWNIDRDRMEGVIFGETGVEYLIVPSRLAFLPFRQIRVGGVFCNDEERRYDRISGILFAANVGLSNFDDAPLPLITNPFSSWTPPSPPFAWVQTVHTDADVIYNRYALEGKKTMITSNN